MRFVLKDVEDNLYFPSYLLMAEQIVQKTKIKQGNCLDVSAGNGLFAIAVARITELKMHILRNSADMMNRAAWNIQRSELKERISLIKGNLRQIPVPDRTMDLVISQNSVFFWQSQMKAFQEIYRVLAPGGVACIGGGFWGAETKRKVDRLLEQYNPALKEGFIWRRSMKKMEEQLVRAKIDSFEINCNDDGLWILIRKPMDCRETYKSERIS